jgi:chromosome segregation ATPase
MARDTLDSAKRDLQAAENHIRTLDNALNRAKQASVRHERDGRDLRSNRQRLDDRIEQLQAELDADAVNDTSALDELHAQYNEAEQALQAANDTMMDSVNAMDQLGNSNRHIKEQLDASTREVEEAQTRLDKAKKRLENKDEERRVALLRKNEALEMANLAQMAKDELAVQRAEQARLVEEDYVPAATEVCRRIAVEPGHTVEVLDRKLEKMEQERQRFHDR